MGVLKNISIWLAVILSVVSVVVSFAVAYLGGDLLIKSGDSSPTIKAIGTSLLLVGLLGLFTGGSSSVYWWNS